MPTTNGSSVLDRLGVTPSQVNRTAMFRGVSLAAIDDALSDCPKVRVDAGTVVIRAGQLLQRMYVIISGDAEVRIASLESAPVATLRGGDIFGEFSLIDGQPASAFVIATSPCTLLGLDKSALWALFGASPEVANNLLTILVSRVRETNSAVHQLQVRLGDAPAVRVGEDAETTLDDPTATAMP